MQLSFGTMVCSVQMVDLKAKKVNKMNLYVQHLEDSIYQTAKEKQPTEETPLTFDTLLNGDVSTEWEGLNPADPEKVREAVRNLANKGKIKIKFAIGVETSITGITQIF